MLQLCVNLSPAFRQHGFEIYGKDIELTLESNHMQTLTDVLCYTLKYICTCLHYFVRSPNY
jgi:hypothetical protein